MLGRHTSPIALDFGDHAVKVLQVERRGGGLELRDARCVTVEPGPSDQRPQRTLAAARRALSLGSFRGRRAYTALRLADVTTRHIRVPAEQKDRVAEFLAHEISEHSAAAGTTSFSSFPVAEVVENGDRKEEFLCCIADAATIQARIDLVEALGLTPVAIDLETCAQVRPFVQASPEASFLSVDLGCHCTRITIVRGGVPVLMRTVRVGGSAMVIALRDKLKLGVDAICDLAEQGDDLERLQKSVTGALAEQLDLILSRIADCVRYCASLFQGRAASPLRLTGSVSGLPGVVQYVRSMIGIKTELADPFAALELASVGGWRRVSQGTYSTALGMALREEP